MSVLKFPLDSRPISDAHWNVDNIVAALGQLRDQAVAVHGDQRIHSKLPSKRHVETIVERLGFVLFPIRLSARQFTIGNVDYFVGHTLDMALSELAEEAERELIFFSERPDQTQGLREESVKRVRNFAASLPEIRRLLETDILAAFEGDPAARTPDEILACYPGVTAIMHHRIAHQIYLQGLPLLARIIAELAHSATGIDIHPGATIGDSFFIDHGTGVVIGETAIIGRRVRLYQAVTLGAKSSPTDGEGVLTKGMARHPIVEDNVVIYAGATILGRVTIGAAAVIGGNVWVTSNVEPGHHVTQAKHRSETFGEGSGI